MFQKSAIWMLFSTWLPEFADIQTLVPCVSGATIQLEPKRLLTA
jgi:hypothetical protein